MLPVPPTAVGPAISLDLDVDDVEMENYEVRGVVCGEKAIFNLSVCVQSLEITMTVMAKMLVVDLNLRYI